jgi:ATP-dependent RNA helicase UAP56/SUB2
MRAERCQHNICCRLGLADLLAGKCQVLNDWPLCVCDLQVVIFVKSVQRAKTLNALLNECNFPSVCIYAGMPQDKRLDVYKNFKDNQVRRLLVVACANRLFRVLRMS